MTLADQIALGTTLPHRSPDAFDMKDVRETAIAAERLGFQDLWVTQNTLDYVYSFDAVVILTYAAAVTRTIRLGTSVISLPLYSPVHIAHQIASLDHVSGGRAVLGVGLGRESHYHDFQVPTERRVRRFLEGVELIKRLWTEPDVDYHGEIYQVEKAQIRLKPVQQPRPPIWLGGTHPDAIRRAASVADGWMGSGNMTNEAFGGGVKVLREALEAKGRDASSFPISKRVFMAVDEDAAKARADVERWFGEAYRNPALTERSGVYGTPTQVREQLESLAGMGANHLLLNTVFHHREQQEILAEVTGLTPKQA
jgi:probable F420-dependent oxidoreductase